MLAIAKSEKGREFLYNASSAHSIPKSSAEKIKSILNQARFDLKDNEVWFIHEVDRFDNAYYYAEGQKFCFRNRRLVRIGY